MPQVDVREEVKRLVEQLPPNASWDDVLQAIMVWRAIERGIDDSQNGRVCSTEAVRNRFGLPV